LGTDTVSGRTQAFDSKNAGARTLAVTGYTVNDGNSGNNYTVATTAAAGSISQRAITVTAQTNSKTYDGTTSAAAAPTLTVGSIATGDTAAFTEVYADKNAGTGKTLTPTGAVNDGNGGANYAVTFANNTTGAIAAKAITITAGSASRV